MTEKNKSTSVDRSSSKSSITTEEQVRFLYMQAPISNIVVILISLLYYYILQPHLNSNMLLLWTLTLLMTASYRMYLWYLRKNKPDAKSAASWLNCYLIGCGLMAGAWSLVYPFLHDTDDLFVWSALLMLAFGVISSAVSILSAYIPAFILYTYPQGLILCVTLLRFENKAYYWLAFAVGLYLIMSTLFARNANRNILQFIKLQERNTNLIHDLNNEINQRERIIAQRTLELKEKNQDLMAEIKNREGAEERLLQVNNNLDATLRAIPDLLFELDENGKYIDLWAQDTALLAAQKKALIGHKVNEMLPSEAAFQVMAAIREAAEKGTSQGQIIKLQLEHDSEHWFELSTSKKEHIDSYSHFLMLSRDITNRMQTEETLRESEERHRLFFENAPIGIIHYSDKGIITAVNDVMVSTFGSSREKLVGLDIDSIPNKKFAEEVCKSLNGQSGYFEGEYSSYTGNKTSYIRAIWIPIKEKGEILAGVGIVEDITERKKANESIQVSEAKFRTIFDSVNDAIFIHDMESGAIVDVNQRMCEMYGLTHAEALQATVAELSSNVSPFRQEDAADRMRKARDGTPQVFDWHARHKNGTLFWTEVGMRRSIIGATDRILVTVRDISERKRAEDDRLNFEKQILHAQKLESLGVLAGGIAHDFNNILTSVIGNADLALRRINPESPAVDNLHSISKAAARAADLAKQMLAYSGKGKFVVGNHDINELLEEMLHILQVSISKKAVLRLNLTRPLPSIEADATQIRQIIMNLVINASEAIGNKSGVIAINTGCMDCDRSYLKDVWLDENLTDGLYVFIEIADSGCGMDKETLTKLFDPFFTTKFTGRGLGMAAVLGIVRSHKGAVKVYSEPDKGSTFKILLPASGKPTEIFNHDYRNEHWKGSGTVLLVDDEETVRGIGAEMLKELGFDVVTANDGCEALEAYKSETDFVFVILDLTMPHMDGEQCYRELRMLNPDVKVILSSGFSESEITQRFAGKGLAGFIQKPYKLSVLQEGIMGLYPVNNSPNE